jgi:hypothetical protein
MENIEMILEVWDLIKSNANPKDRKIIAEKYLEIVSNYEIEIEKHKDDFSDHCTVLASVIRENYEDDYYDNYDEEYED